MSRQRTGPADPESCMYAVTRGFAPRFRSSSATVLLLSTDLLYEVRMFRASSVPGPVPLVRVEPACRPKICTTSQTPNLDRDPSSIQSRIRWSHSVCRGRSHVPTTRRSLRFVFSDLQLRYMIPGRPFVRGFDPVWDMSTKPKIRARSVGGFSATVSSQGTRTVTVQLLFNAMWRKKPQEKVDLPENTIFAERSFTPDASCAYVSTVLDL